MPALFDAHFHILDDRFPLSENQGYAPPVFTVEDYRSRTRGMDVRGGAVIAASFQGYDIAFMQDALARLGPTFVGVVQAPFDVADDEVLRLSEIGVCAVRFNLYRGGPASFADIERLARRVYDLAGWHAELYVDAATLADTWPVIARLPKVSIDHLGMSAGGLKLLLKMAERGVRVKATGFGRISVDPLAAMRALVEADPHCLMFGSDLPSQRARRPFAMSDIDLIRDAVGEENEGRVLYENALDFYNPRVGPGPDEEPRLDKDDEGSGLA